MLYHVIRRPPHNYTDPSTNHSKTNLGAKLMPRYHYSRIAPTTTNGSESFLPRSQFSANPSKPLMTATNTTTSANHNPSPPQSTSPTNSYSYGPLKSTFIPLVTSNRTSTPNKREPIPIPITREDESTNRTVPITFVNTSSSSANNSKGQFTSFFRPTSRYFQHHFHPNADDSSNPNGTASLPRLPSVSRRLSLTIPVVTNVTTSAAPVSTPSAAVNTVTSEDEPVKPNVSSSPSMRTIPIRFPQGSMNAMTNNSRTASAIFRPMSRSNGAHSHQYHSLQRQKTDLGGDPTLTDSSGTFSSPARRAEVMAREAIQGVVRFQEQQQQQQQQQGTNSTFDQSNSLLARSPSLSRRVIVNLKNNQSVSLDSRLSSANPSSSKPPIGPSSSSRLSQRPNLHSIPVTHEIQMPSHPVTLAAEDLPASPSHSSSIPTNPGSFKNEFRMEIPVTIVSNSEHEMSRQHSFSKDEELIDDEQQTLVISERLIATPTPNPTLKSILKRSSSRETVSRKNVSFMNA